MLQSRRVTVCTRSACAAVCRAAMGIARRLGELSPAFQVRLVARCAHVGPLQRSSPIFVMARQQRRVERPASDSMVRSAPRGGRKERMKGSRPDRMPVYGAGLRKKPRAWLWSLCATAPGNSHCTPTVGHSFLPCAKSDCTANDRSPPPCQYGGVSGTFRDSGPLRCRCISECYHHGRGPRPFLSPRSARERNST